MDGVDSENIVCLWSSLVFFGVRGGSVFFYFACHRFALVDEGGGTVQALLDVANGCFHIIITPMY